MEQAVREAEGRVAELEAALADPSLYADGDGAREAARLSAELGKAKQEVKLALARWADVSES